MSLLTDHIHFNRIIFRDQTFTADYLEKAVDDCALYLDRNIRSNSRIVYLFAPNHIKTVIAFLGIIKTGRAALLVDPKVGKLEYEEMLADTKPSAIVKIDPAPIEFDFGKEVEITGYQMDLSEISQLEDVCLLLYSNAEDGYAKAVMLTHNNLLKNADAIAEGSNITLASISMALLPLHHLYGFQNGVITPMISGASFCISDDFGSLKISKYVQSICQSKITHIYSTPLMYYLLSKSPLINQIGDIAYTLTSGGYKLPTSLCKLYREKLRIPLHEGYGLTEASPVCTWQFKDEQYEATSLGRAIKCCKVQIFDDNCNPLQNGAIGEICIKGDNVMKGYFNHLDATQKVINNNWLRTGDYGKQTNYGHINYCGLKKKMYNIAGNKAYPAEIKRFLFKSDMVRQLELSTTFNDIMGDEIHAKVALSDSSTSAQEGFRKWCKHNLTPYNIPKKFIFS